MLQKRIKAGIGLFCALLCSVGLLHMGGRVRAELPSDGLEGIKSDSFVVMDAQTGQVLLSKNADKQEYPASITKIMTLLLALENSDPSDTHVMSEEAVFGFDRDSSHIALTWDEEVTVEQLLYATMLMSANDAANGLAEYVAGSLEAFTPMMNQKAEQIGTKNTHFANAHGIQDENHYTTAYDMALITKYALTVPGFRTVFDSVSYTMAPTNKQPLERQFGTQHSMIVNSYYYYEGAEGGKLGYTPAAQHTCVTTAKRGDMELICVTMRSPGAYDRYSDTAKLFDYCFENFSALSLSELPLDAAEAPLYEENSIVGAVSFTVEEGPHLWIDSHCNVQDIVIDYDLPKAVMAGEKATATANLTWETDLEYLGTTLGSVVLTTSDEVPGTAAIASEQENSSDGLGGIALFLLYTVLFTATLFLVTILMIRQINLYRARKRRRARMMRLSRYQVMNREDMR